MIEINLLPWRENKIRHETRKMHRLLLVVILISIALIILIRSVLIIYQQKMAEEITELDLVLQQKTMKTLMIENENMVTLIEKENINHQQILIKKLFAEIKKISSSQVCLDEIKIDRNDFIFIGRTVSEKTFTKFLMQWHASRLFSKVQLEQLTAQEKKQVLQFRFRAIA